MVVYVLTCQGRPCEDHLAVLNPHCACTKVSPLPEKFQRDSRLERFRELQLEVVSQHKQQGLEDAPSQLP